MGRMSDKIESLMGIGPQRAQLFHKLKIYTVSDLIHYYPRDYEDWSVCQSIDEAVSGETVNIRGKILRTPAEKLVSGGKKLYETEISDGDNELRLVFFNNKYVMKQLSKGESYIFRGKISGNFMGKSMTSPAFIREGKSRAIQPVYPLTQGLSSNIIAASVYRALESVLPTLAHDPLPQEICIRNNLCSLDSALKGIHFPKNMDSLEKARKRLIFQEFLTLQVGMMRIKSAQKQENLHITSGKFPNEFVISLPFHLTGAQKRAVKDAVKDMAGSSPMNRLIQGDVGSGKTAVAAAVCWTAAKEGMQAAFMAPTEILARQHYQSLRQILEPMGIPLVLLTGSCTPSQKREIYDKLESGEAKLAIGTHALISEKVRFQNLGLVVTDEQHRFGVGQRAALVQKGNIPHVLLMSATPIPRTLALLMYGDLDVSVLDELPPGRQKTETYLIDSPKRRRAFGYVQKHLDQGRQGYLICPLVEGQDDGGMASVTQYIEMARAFFPGSRVGMLHGKMKPADKDDVMQKFAEGEIHLLVATTVVEVGVDVPNAVIMLIENAERYGLSQLHQLRGRIGRGKHKSTCILLSDSTDQETIERLRILCRTTDGFEIADEDLRLRGPGDFLGTRQHGLPQLKLADMMKDMALLQEAQACAVEILSDENSPAFIYFSRQTDEMFKDAGGFHALN